ncbi:MAG: hypothetical protein AVDCRST_MAG33-1367 [uncultured Thermomicrobiales bacterium]|uniref:Uncharacterized protein n=1 Tax=uncultured Thermomicrobiales bacterium TaxID=1645740 RepID=A0A6J4UQM5_9BACT|nr:MAG: hypothetical protein AVDCRST_MAG33-1367 [uncultured Thermomicrobiales bacterium]
MNAIMGRRCRSAGTVRQGWVGITKRSRPDPRDRLAADPPPRYDYAGHA